MPDGKDEGQIGQLLDAVHKLTATTERVADSLAKLELLYIDTLQKQAADRVEAKERQKKFDELQEEFKIRQKRWDAREEKWEKQGWQWNPWLVPGQIANLLLLIVALVVLAFALGVMGTR